MPDVSRRLYAKEGFVRLARVYAQYINQHGELWQGIRQLIRKLEAENQDVTQHKGRVEKLLKYINHLRLSDDVRFPAVFTYILSNQPAVKEEIANVSFDERLALAEQLPLTELEVRRFLEKNILKSAPYNSEELRALLYHLPRIGVTAEGLNVVSEIISLEDLSGYASREQTEMIFEFLLAPSSSPGKQKVYVHLLQQMGIFRLFSDEPQIRTLDAWQTKILDEFLSYAYEFKFNRDVEAAAAYIVKGLTNMTPEEKALWETGLVIRMIQPQTKDLAAYFASPENILEGSI